MTGSELKSFRIGRGMSLVTFAQWLGMKGKRSTVSARLRNIERGRRIVPDWIVLMVEKERRHDDC
jgi:hypothetical protein